MDIRWEDDGDLHLLYFIRFYDEELVATVSKDEDGDFLVSSEMLGLEDEYIDGASSLEDAKELTEDAAIGYFEGMISYYTESLEKFKEAVLERRGLENENTKPNEEPDDREL